MSDLAIRYLREAIDRETARGRALLVAALRLRLANLVSLRAKTRKRERERAA